jgi:hypothetical protein
MEKQDAGEQDDLYRFVMKTEHRCAACDDPLCLTEEVVVITVVLPVIEATNFFYAPAEADDNDFLYEPRFCCYECWEDVVNELSEMLDNTPPIEEISAVVLCSVCKSGICLGEVMGLGTMGEFQCSQRSPEIAATTIFDAQDPDPTPICVACLRKLSEDYLDLWESVGQGDECQEGTEIRCWRHGCPGADACILKRS